MSIVRHNWADDATQIYGLLYSLGLHADFTGFFYTSYAVMLIAAERERILFPEKWIYPEVAKIYNTTKAEVYVGIRQALDRAWKNAPAQMELLFCRDLQQEPSVAQFLLALTMYLLGSWAA